ncbi:potassium-transporting ATPase subunit B [Streptomyces kronopolitis]|uniref:Potassium-transporting ATPase subunit B n=1 Tax=Streptomyces kronopolitis TaxID=1612435 RepID=A0ABQ2IYN8_9ACTN|nr:PP2C family protein-serine/threonine phosphatase [Streptomyces kronopolitis]GGN32284.1 potassium-transporting ATPase subunit B [Streptomyces kronopolitis]
MSPHTFHTLPSLRHAVRGICRAHRLPSPNGARLVLSVSRVATAALDAGGSVRLEAVEQPAPGGRTLLAVTLHAGRTPASPSPAELPLPGQATPDGTVAWHLPLGEADSRGGDRPPSLAPPAPRGDAPAPGGAREAAATEGYEAEIAALEGELGAALSRVDTLSTELHRLKDELAETNSGVLALYVQLEERDEQLRRAHGQILRELEDALRPPPITVNGMDLAVHYAPADPDAPTGGDFYDWLLLPDGTVHITVVDALGHGVRSTRSALNVTHAVRTLALEGHPLESIVARTHDILAPFDPDLMATVLLARIDPETGALQLANGSHPPALVVRADGTADYLELRGRGIGFPLPGSDTVREDTLHEGDLLMLYTDGLTESRRDPIEGEARLVTSARAHARRPVEEIPGAVAKDMHTVILHPDDTLALAVRRTGKPQRGHPLAGQP